jgi:hypothetical protein
MPAPQGRAREPFGPIVPSQPPLGFVPGLSPAAWPPPSENPFRPWPLWLPAFAPAAQAPARPPVSMNGGEPDLLDAHHAALDDALRAADVPPKMFDMRERNGAATLMAKAGMAPPDAIEHAVLRDLLHQGHFTQGEFDHIYGQGAFDAVSRGAAPQGGLGPADEGGAPDRPGAAPSDDGTDLLAPRAREAGASFGEDDPVVAPAPGLGAPQGQDALAARWHATAAPSVASTPPPDPSDFRFWPPSQVQTNEGRETGPSFLGEPAADPAIDHPLVLAAGGRGPGSYPAPFQIIQELLQAFRRGNRAAPKTPSLPDEEEAQAPPSRGMPGQEPGVPATPPRVTPAAPPVVPATPQGDPEQPTSQPLTRPTRGDRGFDPRNLEDKLKRYLLEPEHPENQGKAVWFQKALGFDRNNWQDLASQLHFDESKAIFQKTTPWGNRYSQHIPIIGPNGRTIDVEFIFQKDENGHVTLITGMPPEQ